MIDFKKLDDKDFVFINKPLNEKDDKAFSDFLKARKEKSLRAKKKEPTKRTSIPIGTNRQHWRSF